MRCAIAGIISRVSARRWAGKLRRRGLQGNRTQRFGGLSSWLERQVTAEHDLRLAWIAAANLPDAIILFAAAFQFGFDGAMILQRDDKDHAHAHVEGAEQIVALEFAETGEVGKNRRHGPRAELDFGLHAP